MDGDRFDDLTRALGRRTSRRRWLKGLAGGMAAMLAGGAGAKLDAEAAGRSLTICHATGNPAAPWQSMTIDQSEFNLHARHGDYLRVECCANSDCASTMGVCGKAVCQNGYCSQLPVAAGTPCDDGRYCTTNTVCDGAFTCAGAQVECAAPINPCNIASCSEATQGCAETRRPDGSQCGSVNACSGHFCASGVCVDQTLKTCPPPVDSCHGAGVCDPVSGRCSNPALQDGTSCSTGDLCVSSQTCLSGVCQGGRYKECPRSSSEVIVCQSGVCVITGCKEPYSTCGGDLSNGCPIDTSEDPANCGACGNICGANEACCSGVCLNLLTSPDNCGVCGNGCGANEACCNGQCLDLTSPDHCGSCDALPCEAPPVDSCWESAICVSGVCGFAPKPVGAECDDHDLCTFASACDGAGQCVATLTLTCQPSRYSLSASCQNGVCQIDSCWAGHADCDGEYLNGCEIVTDSDPDNCGACGNVCPTIDGGTAICLSGFCGISCDAGGTLCGNACLDLTSNVSNCGSCGNNCTEYGHHFGNDVTCQDSACSGTCLSGWADCDGNPNNGCETNIAMDSSNCGACGNQCGDAFYCYLGRCVIG